MSPSLLLHSYHSINKQIRYILKTPTMQGEEGVWLQKTRRTVTTTQPPPLQLNRYTNPSSGFPKKREEGSNHALYNHVFEHKRERKTGDRQGWMGVGRWGGLATNTTRYATHTHIHTHTRTCLVLCRTPPLPRLR